MPSNAAGVSRALRHYGIVGYERIIYEDSAALSDYVRDNSYEINEGLDYITRYMAP